MKHETGGDVQAAAQIPAQETANAMNFEGVYDNGTEMCSCLWESSEQTKEEIIRFLQRTPYLYGVYRRLNEKWKERFLDFCQGKKTLPLTYDPFFKYIFNPEIYGPRLSAFISDVLGVQLKVIRVLSSEDSMFDGESYVIMDLLAELEDGAICNIEIQKQGYAFPAERISCYSSDLVMRQYLRVKGALGNKFTYRDIKKVYVIVFYETSPAVFHQFGSTCVHPGRPSFDTGLPLNMVEEYCLVALDVFRKIPYSEREKNGRNAWLSLLTTEKLSDAEQLIKDYPWMEAIFQEIAMLRRDPEEVLRMWSEALRILDENSLKYYVDELKEEVDALKAEKDILKAEKDAALSEKDAEIAALKKLLAAYEN